MKNSQVVLALAELASKVVIEVTPSNIGTLKMKTEKLFSETARLINELEEAEKEDANEE